MADLRKNKSKIWKHFSHVSRERAKCSYCNKIISHSGGATGNLARHLKSQHKSVILETVRYSPVSSNTAVNTILAALMTSVSTPAVNSMPVSSVSASTSNAINPVCIESNGTDTTLPIPAILKQSHKSSFVSRPISVSHSKQLDEQLTKTIVKQHYPFEMVEDKEFNNFVHMLRPNYSMPSRKTLVNSLIPRLYNETKETVSKMLVDVEAVCLSASSCTSINQQDYLSLTAHFVQTVDGVSSLQSCLLGFIPYDSSHKSKKLANMLKEEVCAWRDLDKKIACIVTENAPYIVEAVKLNLWSHFPCFADSLNLVLAEGIAVIEPQISKVKCIMAHFKHSHKACVKLATIQKESNLPEVKFNQDCVAGSNSTHNILKQILTTKAAVIDVLAIENPDLNCLSHREWALLEKANEIFEIFQDITREITAQKSVTLSKVMLMLNTINTHLLKKKQENEFKEISEIIQVLTAACLARFKDLDTHEIVTQATILDPRFKHHGFQAKFKFDRAVETLRRTMLPISNLNICNNTQPSTSHNFKTEPSPNGGYINNAVQNVFSNPNVHIASAAEVDMYLNEPLLPRAEDPLRWWDERKHVYPSLYKLVNRRLCIVSSVPCERGVCSKAGLTLDDRRSCLKPEQAAQYLFLNYNL